MIIGNMKWKDVTLVMIEPDKTANSGSVGLQAIGIRTMLQNLNYEGYSRWNYSSLL